MLLPIPLSFEFASVHDLSLTTDAETTPGLIVSKIACNKDPGVGALQQATLYLRPVD